MKDTTVPLTLISLLADGEFHSGEQLGERLGMSRAAINKHIQTLRDWGVDVFTVPGKDIAYRNPSSYWMLTVFIANWIAETWRYCPLSIQPISIYLIELASCVQAMPV